MTSNDPAPTPDGAEPAPTQRRPGRPRKTPPLAGAGGPAAPGAAPKAKKAAAKRGPGRPAGLRPGQSCAKIRRYVLRLIYRNTGVEFRMPSSKLLAAKLHVARSTVNVVLKDLRDGGYIRGVNGVGTFTNAWNVPPAGPHPQPVVSLLYGDGRMQLYDSFAWNLMAATGNAALRRGFALNAARVSFDAQKTTNALDEINDNRCDCLVWFVPGDAPEVVRFMRYYQETGRRLILVPCDNRHADPAFNSVSFDYYQGGFDLGRAMLAEGRHTLCYLFKDLPHDTRLAGIRAAFAAAGRPLQTRIFRRDAQHDAYAPLRARLAAGKIPSAIFAAGEHVKAVRAILEEFHVDTATQCRLLGEAHCLDVSAFDGYAMELPFDKLGAEVAGLAARLQSDLATREQIRVACPVRACGAAIAAACAAAASPPAPPAGALPPDAAGAVVYDDGEGAPEKPDNPEYPEYPEMPETSASPAAPA